MDKFFSDPYNLSYIPRFGLLLFAISPVTYPIDWLFYTISGVVIFSFLVFIICMIIGSIRNKYNFSKILMGHPKDNIYDVMISIAGVIINYAIPDANMIYLWVFLLICSILELIFPNPKALENKKDSEI
jgi:hypothetical protein